MTALADTPLVPLDLDPTPKPTGGSTPLAAALVAAPLLLGGSIALHPDDTQGVEHTLTHIAGESTVVWALVHLVEPFAWLLLGVALLLALPRLATRRGGRPLKAAAVMCGIGFASFAFVVYGHGEAFHLMAATLEPGSVEPSVYGPLFEQFEVGMPLAAPLTMVARLGLLFAIVGMIRSRTVPVWAALLLLGPVVLLGSTGLVPLVVQIGVFFVPLLVTLGVIARRVARTGGPALG